GLPAPKPEHPRDPVEEASHVIQHGAQYRLVPHAEGFERLAGQLDALGGGGQIVDAALELGHSALGALILALLVAAWPVTWGERWLVRAVRLRRPVELPPACGLLRPSGAARLCIITINSAD